MIIRNFLRPFLLLVLIVSLVGCSHSPQEISRSIAATDYGEFGLPLGVQNLLYTEQVLLSREVDEEIINSPNNISQGELYKPENQNIFELKTYWINEDELVAFKTDSANPELEKLMHRTVDGISQWRLIVHPESEQFYSELVKKGKPAGKFLATSTASSRTLIIWQPSRPDLVFFGKLSLDREIGGVVRTIPGGEVARSIGTTTMLDSIESDLPKDFYYLPETMGVMPKGFERGGMIIREIPDQVKSGQDSYVPLFSLYAKCLKCKKKPLLIGMINNSKIGTEDFIRSKIISPFLDQWLELLIKEGIVMEAHAQNVLIGIDDEKIVNGKFLHRDFGGFNIDLKFRKKFKLSNPKEMVFITSLKEDYHQKFHVKAIEQSLHTYFIGGFVYNLDKNLSKWASEGLIPVYGNGKSSSFFRDMVFKELGKKLGIKRWSELRDPQVLSEVINKLKYSPEAMHKPNKTCSELLMKFVR